MTKQPRFAHACKASDRKLFVGLRKKCTNFKVKEPYFTIILPSDNLN